MTFSAMKLVSDASEATPVDLLDTVLQVTVSSVSGMTLAFAELLCLPGMSSVTIDWGDGTVMSYSAYSRTIGTETFYGVWDVSHTYAASGNYRILVSDYVESLAITGSGTSVGSGIWESSSGMTAAVRRIECLAPHLKRIGGYGAAKLISLLPGRVRHAGNGVAIGDYGFCRCYTIRAFNEMAPVFTESGVGAFSYCSSLRTLAGMSAFDPVSDRSFYACTSLESLVGGFSSAVDEFGEAIFERCSSLTSLAGIPSTLETIGPRAFAYCTSLVSLAQIASTGVTEYPDYCFYGCTSLTGLAGSGAVTSFGAHCFERTALITSLSGAPAVTECGERCFAYSGITAIQGSTVVTKFGDECFRGCPGISGLGTLWPSLEEFGAGCFRDCFERVFKPTGEFDSQRGLASIGSIRHRGKISVIPDFCFYGDGCIITLGGIDIKPPPYITRLGRYSFANCIGLQLLDGIPSTLVMSVDANTTVTPDGDDVGLGKGVFSGCYDPPFKIEPVIVGHDSFDKAFGGLTDISAVSSLARVDAFPDEMFRGCALIPDMPALPSGLYWLGDGCFRGCHNLQTLDSFADLPARTGIAGSAGEGGEVHAWLPHFGAYCFAECDWPDEVGYVKPDPESMLYRSDPENPPEIHPAGLGHIGGIRVFCEKLERELLLESEGVHVVQMISLFEQLYKPALSALPESVTTRYDVYQFLYYWFSLPGQFIQGNNSPYGPTLWHEIFETLTTRAEFGYAEDSSIGGTVFVVTPEFDNSSSLTGLNVRFLFSYFMSSSLDLGDFDCSPDDTPFDPASDTPEVLVDRTRYQIRLKPAVLVSPLGSSLVYFKDGMLGFELSVYDKNTTDQTTGDYLLVGSAGYNESVSFPELPGTLYALHERFASVFLNWSAIANYTVNAFYASPGRFPISDCASVISALTESTSFRDALRKALLLSRFIGTSDTMFGDHCFYKCKALTVPDAVTQRPASNLDGWPAIAPYIPDYCFAESGVTPSAAFRFVRSIGRGAFRKTGTTSLAHFPPVVSYVPSECFAECGRLAGLGDLPAKLTSYADSAFDGCVSLVDLTYTGADIVQYMDDHLGAFSSAYDSRYSEYVDQFRRARLVETLGPRAFRGTAVESLLYEHAVPQLATVADAQSFISAVFGALHVEVEATGAVDRVSYLHFLLRVRAGAWKSQEVLFSGSFDVGDIVSGTPSTTDNSSGFDMNGNALAAGCIDASSIRLIRVSGDHSYYPAYGYEEDRPPYKVVWTNSNNGTDYIEVDDCEVRVMCPSGGWYSSRDTSGSSTDSASGDSVWLFIGPYRFNVGLCFGVVSKNVAAPSGGARRLRSIEFELKGVQVRAFSRIADISDDGLVQVPVFPVLRSLGTACFENCAQLKGLSGLPVSVVALPSRCFAGCPFTHEIGAPEVEPPVVRVVMPALTERVAFRKELDRSFFVERALVSGSALGTYVELKLSTHYNDSTYVGIKWTVDQDPDSGEYVLTPYIDPNHNTFSPVQYSGIECQPVVVGLDGLSLMVNVADGVHEKIILRVAGYGVNQYCTYSGRVYDHDTVEEEMRVYLDACLGAVAPGDGTALAPDFQWSSPGLVDRVEGADVAIASPLMQMSWDRDDGTWEVIWNGSLLYVANTGGDRAVIYVGPTGFPGDGDGYYELKCREHESWRVQLLPVCENVQVHTSSVAVPNSVTSVGADCFTFDKYLNDGRDILEAVYFPGRSASQVRGMTGYPFGVPPGCSIYAGGTCVYTEPLPS